MRYEAGKVVKTTRESSNLFFRTGNWNFLNGFYLSRINFDAFTTDEKTHKLFRPYSECALIGVQPQLVLLQPLELLV